MKNHVDIGSSVVVVITFILFVMALFFKGITHDLLLEAGIFLVSVKLVIMSYKNNEFTKHLDDELHEIKDILNKL